MILDIEQIAIISKPLHHQLRASEKCTASLILLPARHMLSVLIGLLLKSA